MKHDKIIEVVNIVLNQPNLTNIQISELTGISASSIQRYLNDPLIEELYDSNVVSKIAARNISNSVSGKRKGGINSFKNNLPIKDQDGKFVGSMSYKGDSDRLEKKCNDILILYKIILSNEVSSLDELTLYYNDVLGEKSVTKSYVYDCLTSSYTQDLLGSEGINQIKKWFDNNNQIGKKMGADITNSRNK